MQQFMLKYYMYRYFILFTEITPITRPGNPMSDILQYLSSPFANVIIKTICQKLGLL